MTWTTHLCNAGGKLNPLKDRIHEAIALVREKVEAVARPVSLDVVVQVIPGGVIPERGFVGHTLTGDLVYLTIDPANQNLRANMGEPFERMIAHELHHALRFGTVGYGSTLGEALVAEGLAGLFSHQLYGNAPEPWEAPETSDLDHLEAAEAAWDAAAYDHRAWFFGSGDYPRWLGYRLGYRLVEAYLTAHPAQTAASLADAPAADFRSVVKSLAA
ncbi:DUF2268 domain-containing putative Zn-dependent protease [Roseibium sp.]|uniref:DUF2268 domain-containing putative Zn-dependent protease n=1 Tax=Roseibium sp. TaxID=1936156 RepID=UPI003BB03D1B